MYIPDEKEDWEEDDTYDEEDEYWDEGVFSREDVEEHMERIVKKMNKAELQEALLELLAKSPDWLYLRFAHDYIEIDGMYY